MAFGYDTAIEMAETIGKDRAQTFSDIEAGVRVRVNADTIEAVVAAINLRLGDDSPIDYDTVTAYLRGSGVIRVRTTLGPHGHTYEVDPTDRGTP